MGLSGGTSAKCEERYTRPLRTLRSPLAGRPPRSRKFRAAKVRSSAKSITRRGCSALSRVLSLSFGKSEIVLNHYHLYSAIRLVERRTRSCKLLLRALQSFNRLESSLMPEHTDSSILAQSPPVSRRERKKERTRSDIYNAEIHLFLYLGVDSVTRVDI